MIRKHDELSTIIDSKEDSMVKMKSQRRGAPKDMSTIEIEKKVGAGMYGQVYRAKDKETLQIVALKKITFGDKKESGFPVPFVREIKILKALKQLSHKNIVNLIDVVAANENFGDNDEVVGDGSSSKSEEEKKDKEGDGKIRYLKGDIFMIFEFVPFDLAGLIKSPGAHFTPDHKKSFAKQLLDGVFFMHCNNILHRDIKAANILVTRGNVLKIADWGLARSVRAVPKEQRLSGPVIVTLWYRCPELLLETCHYGFEVDMWSVGCLIAEIALGEELLPGKVEIDQLELIYKLCGSPKGDTLAKFEQYPGWEKMQVKTAYEPSFSSRFRSVDPKMVDLLQHLLDMDPTERMSAKDACDHGYFWGKQRLVEPEELPKFHVDDCHDYEVNLKRKEDSLLRMKKQDEMREKRREQERLSFISKSGQSKGDKPAGGPSRWSVKK
jgi:cyclin-dependent kinase 12/13